MSGTNTGRAPRTDAEWARELTRRVTNLENPDTSRIGEWVISSKDGQLVATKQGAQVIIGNSEVTATEFTDAIRGVHREAEKAKDAADNAQETADSKTPLEEFEDFLDGAKQAGEGILKPIGGAIGEALGGLLNIFQIGKDADTKATNAKNSADAAVQVVGITSGTIGDLLWVRNFYKNVGTTTWTVPTAPAGYQLERVDFQLVGPGQGGPKPPINYEGVAEGGKPGGFVRRSFTPAEVGPAGTVYNLSIPGGTPGATSTGPASEPARATVRRADTNALLVQSSKPGTSGIYMTAGIPSTDQKPGAGGANGPAIYYSGSDGSSGGYTQTDGQPGQPSLEASGGQPGRGPTGWFGTGKTVPTAGEDAPEDDPYYRYCGGGGGGGGGGANGPGGAGGRPGGGGGTGAPNNTVPLFPAATNGGPGGAAEIVVWAVYAPIPVA